MKTVIVQFEYEITNNNIYGEYRSESQIQYTLDACKESMEIYAEEHGYDFKYITETAPFHEAEVVQIDQSRVQQEGPKKVLLSVRYTSKR